MPVNTLCIFGTRPEAIKMAPVIQQLNLSNCFNNKNCITGQHREMLDPVLSLFSINVDFDLNVMTKNQNLSTLTSKILVGVFEILEEHRPQCILVHGDTTTALAASLAAYYHQIPIIHVEAGLRTSNIYSPWPEEANRCLVGSLAALHFAPTKSAAQNLLKENIPAESIFVTGNTVVDSLFAISEKIEMQPDLLSSDFLSSSFLNNGKPIILVTGHRRENFGGGFKSICEALLIIAKKFPSYQIIYPVHLNPNVQTVINELLTGIKNISLIPPVDYLSFVYLMRKAYLILTDSGGIQEEAPSLGKPVLVMREVTERPEAVEAGTVKLVGTDIEKIVESVSTLINNQAEYNKISHAINPYGDGNAAVRIVNILRTKYAADFSPLDTTILSTSSE